MSELRRSPARAALEELGASFAERDGAEVVAAFAGEEPEYRAVRSALGVSDFSHVLKYRSQDEDAIVALDEVLAGDVASTRYGRVTHTLLADEAGMLVADVYVASNDEELLVLCECCAPRARVEALLRSREIGLEDVTEELALFSVDGPRAWALPAELLTRNVLGMPYLSVESHALGEVPVRLVRAGKTGEFGYLFLVPAASAAEVWRTLAGEARARGGAPCGLAVHDALRLDGRFHNVEREGRAVRDPLPLGLQWMIDFRKDAFVGRDAILARRAAKPARKVVGLALAPGRRGAAPGATVRCDGEEVGAIVTSAFSYTLGREMALALLESRAAYAGLSFEVDGAGPADSLTLPPFVPESLRVKLDEL